MNKRFILSTTAITAVAIGNTSFADLPVDFEISGPGGTTVQYDFNAAGTVGMVHLQTDFVNQGGWTWAGDLLFAIVDLDGNAIEFGGYDMSFGYTSAGDFSSGWDVSSSGSFSTDIDLSTYGLNGVASVMFMDGYSAGASTDHWSGILTIGGVGGDPVGACCYGEECSIESAEMCGNMGSIYMGDGTDCDDWPCGDPSGACCYNEMCSVDSEAGCNKIGGEYQGHGTDCMGDPCAPDPTGACCVDSDCLSDLTETACDAFGGSYLGDATWCDADSCLAPSGNTIDFNVSGPGGNMVEYQIDTAGTLTHLDFDLVFTNAGDLTWAGDLLIGITDPNGNSIEYGGYNMTLGYPSAGDFPAEEWDVADSGNYMLEDIDVSGYGLQGSGLWTIEFVDGYETSVEGTNWTGTMTAGGLSSDDTADGACCILDACDVYTADDCVAMGGTYNGDDVACADVQCTVPCEGDANGDGQVNVSDILIVIGDWGSGAGPADINNDGIVNVTDLLLVIANFNNC